MNSLTKVQSNSVIWFTLVVAALGYLVDIFDTILFSIVRVPSLRDLGLSGSQITEVGMEILRLQMAGILIGAFFWGILADKKGRLPTIIGSIAIYSLATLLNGFVHNVIEYKILRFVAGFGLAGELGAAITLIAELMSKSKRGLGTALVAGIGGIGAIVASLAGQYLEWKTAYIMGGICGFALLFLRFGMKESEMFNGLEKANPLKGNPLLFFSSFRRTYRYLCCIFLGLPVWFAIGIFVSFSPEIGLALHVSEPIVTPKAFLYFYVGFTLGDFFSGILSQWLKSRKKAVLLMLTVASLTMGWIYTNENITAAVFYSLCTVIGLGSGYWVLFATISSEQFGTNCRAFVTTTTPQLLRATVIPMTFMIEGMKKWMNIGQASLIIAVLCLIFALFSLSMVDETYSRDLNYLEKG